MRLKTANNVLEKTFTILPLQGVYAEVLGQPEASGLWLIYGADKHGKTTISLTLAAELGKYLKTAYIMAEQGFDLDFQQLLRRLAITQDDKSMLFSEYVPIEELDCLLKKRKQPDIIFLDNLTVYAEELKGGALRKLLISNPKKLFIALAHEENGMPYTATARLAKKLAKRIIHVEGNTATVEGRGPGGSIVVDENNAALYWGTPEGPTPASP